MDDESQLQMRRREQTTTESHDLLQLLAAESPRHVRPRALSLTRRRHTPHTIERHTHLFHYMRYIGE